MKKVIILLGTFILLSCRCVFSQSNLENKYDVKQYILNLQISNTSTILSGNVIMNAKVTATSLDTVAVELINTITSTTYMIVDSVFINGSPASFQHIGYLVFIPLTTSFLQNQLFSLQIYYHGNAEGCAQTSGNGISLFNYTGKSHTCSFSQPTESRVWWPCKQDLQDKADSVTFYITTDSTNKSGSNGILKSIESLLNGKVKYKWEIKHPISPYLVSFVVGPMTENITYAHLPSSQDSVLLQSLLFPASSNYQTHLIAIEKTKQLIFLFSELFGTYPFQDEKYGYCVVGTPVIGMENQTLCTMGYQSLDTTSTLYYNYYFWFMTAHELGHQWFGDDVTCAGWNYAWLCDGFASYMEYVALQNLESQTKADYWIQNAHTEVISLPGGSVYVPDSLVNINNIFDYRLIYKKGASILHTLRYEINNDSLFFEVLRNYLSTYAFSIATADDFKQVAETTTGINFTDFFNQWYYGQGYPTFDLNWNQHNDTLILTSNQTTSTATTTLFKTHFDVRINYLTGDSLIRLYQGSNDETYKIYFPYTVTSIEFDPYFWLIQQNSITTGIIEKNNSNLFGVFPNPAKDQITIVVKHENILKNTMISIFNIEGQLLLQQQIMTDVTEINISGFAKGVYIIKLSNNEKSDVSRFVKE